MENKQEDLEVHDKEMVIREYFETFGFPVNYDNWPEIWKECYCSGLYDMFLSKNLPKPKCEHTNTYTYVEVNCFPYGDTVSRTVCRDCGKDL